MSKITDQRAASLRYLYYSYTVTEDSQTQSQRSDLDSSRTEEQVQSGWVSDLGLIKSNLMTHLLVIESWSIYTASSCMCHIDIVINVSECMHVNMSWLMHEYQHWLMTIYSMSIIISITATKNNEYAI